MSEEKKLAVLIDSDNVSAKYAQFVMNEVQKYGVPTYKRVYGDWEKGGNGWHAPAVNYSIMPVQQTSYVAGKNATDFSMIIDAMDILYTGNVDGFVLVTSDSDFTRLAIRLREAGKLVVGIGELKTPRPFTVSCHHFCYLNQIGEMEASCDEPAIRKAVLTFVTDNKDERLDLARISAVLTSKFGNINFDELGYKRFSNFIDSFPELRRNNTFVSLRKKRQEQPAPARAVEAATEQSISAAMQEYLSEHEPENDNMLKLESYLNSRFGKIDFAKFGSTRFARFIDKLPQFTRTGTLVKPAEAAPEVTLDAGSYRREVMTYAGDNMPDGGNIGQLNNRLMSAFGKDYFRALGFGDFKSALSSVGEVRVDGVNVTHLKLKQLRHNIGFATQDVLLYSDTIDGNISFGDSDMPEEDVVKYAKAADADGFIRKLSDGYETIVGERGVGLSGGQKQRISLARALAVKPSILILDDTTSAVDLETEKHIQNALANLDFPCTKLIIAQRISTAKYADKIIVLKDGKISEQGTHEELIKQHGYYREVFDLQK